MNSTKKIIYIDMDDVICDYQASYQQKRLSEPEIKYPQSQCDFYRKLAPIPKAIESVNYLNQQALFDVYILTAPSVRNPLCYTEKRLWIEDHLGLDMVNKLIISPNKGLNKGDYLIDDMVSGRGQENFEGKLLQFGSSEYPNWEAIIGYFKQQYLHDKRSV
jgi:5'(3')-deoxyribonucleotidase